MTDRTVIIFLKVPEKGCVKTRLCGTFDKGFVLALYKAFVLDTIHTAEQVEKCHIFFTPGNGKAELVKWLGSDYSYSAQSGDDIGIRMVHAFEQVFEKGVKKAVLIGTDIPSLEPVDLEQAFGILNDRDAVIGPAKDGGYYLIGFSANTFCHELFSGIEWSTPAVLDQTLVKFDQAGISAGLIREHNDIDTPFDLEALVSDIKSGGYAGKETLRVLNLT